MAEAKSDETEGKEENKADLGDFLDGKGLSQYKDALIEAGLETLQMLNNLDDDMINEIITDVNIKKLHRKMFLKAVKQFQDGTYKPKPKPKIYDPFKELRDERKDLKDYIHKTTEDITGKETKTVIFIGQTGVGKTTFINSMCNYLYQVSYKEKFRYKLIDEKKDDDIKDKDDTESQTQVITKYHLENLPAFNDYSHEAITIVDTPGFGDTKGVKEDMKIRDKFKHFFETNCPFIDGIYFIIKASDTRVGAIQKYIFKMVLDLFGEDVKENIFILFTFSDGSKPCALSAVNKYFVKALNIEKATYFEINNSGFNLPDAESSQTHQWYFNLGMKQFGTIFDELSRVRTKSTLQTQETLKERENITAGLKKIDEKLKLQLISINYKNVTLENIKTHIYAIKKDPNYKIPSQKTVINKENVSHDKYTTYCRKCNETCCNECNVKDWKYWCGVMSWGGSCTICAGKCGHGDHEHANFIIRRKIETKYETLSDMGKRLLKNKKATVENVIKAVTTDVDKCEKEIHATIQAMKNSVTRLQEIALNKKVVSTTNDEYFDVLITAEKSQKEEGWQKRVEELIRMKSQNKKLNEVYDKDKNLTKKWRKNMK